MFTLQLEKFFILSDESLKLAQIIGEFFFQSLEVYTAGRIGINIKKLLMADYDNEETITMHFCEVVVVCG